MTSGDGPDRLTLEAVNGRGHCHDGPVDEYPQDAQPPLTRRSRLRLAAQARGIPLPTILVTVAVVVATYLAGKLVYRLRDIILLIVVAGFIALLLNPLVVALQRWRVKRRGAGRGHRDAAGPDRVRGPGGSPSATRWPTASPTWPTHCRATCSDAEHGRGWIGHLVRRYHVQHWVQHRTRRSWSTSGQGLAKPALSLGKGAFSLLLALLTIFVLVRAPAARGHQDAPRPAGPDGAERGRSATPGSPARSAIRSSATCWATS